MKMFFFSWCNKHFTLVNSKSMSHYVLRLIVTASKRGLPQFTGNLSLQLSQIDRENRLVLPIYETHQRSHDVGK